MNRRNNLRLLLIFILIGFVISPAFADETTINLNPETPYVDIPIEATEPTQITIQTTTGTPQTNSGFIDSWIELWQGQNKLRADDDGAHSATNILASFITAPIDAGVYFIRATSFAWMASQQTQFPTGSYLLTWNGVTTIPTLTPTPTPTPTETITPTPEPTPTEVLPTLIPSQEPTSLPTQEPITDNSNNEEIFVAVIPETLLTLEPTQIVTPELEITEQITEPETIEPPILEPELSLEELQEQIQEQINAEYIEENTIQLELPTALVDIPGAELIFASAEAVLNVGSDMTKEEREEAQSVVVSAIVLTQIAQMASAGISNRRVK
jgi:hypothetical protein